MKEKLESKLNNLKNNPEFQEKLQEMKPSRSIWGFLGVILLFFVPEAINILYHQEINSSVVAFANLHYPTEIADKMIWLTKKFFNGKLSFVNLGLGFAFLYWMFRK